MIYQTMTPKGSTGSHFDAQSDEEACALAEQQGYEVLDIQEAFSNNAGEGFGFDFILVIPDD